MAVAVEIVPYTGRPTFRLAFEAEVRILEFQGTVDLLESHGGTSLRERIENKHRVIVWWLREIFWRVGRFGGIVGGWRPGWLALFDGRSLDELLGSVLHGELASLRRG